MTTQASDSSLIEELKKFGFKKEKNNEILYVNSEMRLAVNMTSKEVARSINLELVFGSVEKQSLQSFLEKNYYYPPTTNELSI